MAIGTTAAIIGSAVLGAGASAVASGNNSRAINRSTEAQTQSNQQSVALQRDIYNQNRNALSPWQSGGLAAFNQRNALLGLNTQPAQQPIQQQAPQVMGYNRAAMNDLSPRQGAGLPYGIGDNFIMTGQFDNGAFNDNRPNALQAPTNQTSGNTQADAFDQFRNSTGYEFRLGEGLDALGSVYSGSGMLQSGAAMRGINEYGQDFASNEFGNYMGMLGQQQGAGLQAAGAQAGVGLSYANNVTNLNQQNANALSNAAVARANNNNALIGGIGGLASGVLGGLAG